MSDRTTDVSEHERNLSSGKRTRVTRHKRRLNNIYEEQDTGRVSKEELLLGTPGITDDDGKIKETAPVEALDGVGKTYAQMLHEEGIDTVGDLGEAIRDDNSRNGFAEQNQNLEAILDNMAKTLTELDEAAGKYQRAEDDLRLEPLPADTWGNDSEYYGLTERVDRSDWAKIAEYMEKHYIWDDDAEGNEWQFAGWRVKPGYEENVERALKIRGTRTREGFAQVTTDYERLSEEYGRQRAVISEQVDTFFDEYGEYRPGKQTPKGTRYWESKTAYHYGGGSWWIVGEDKIWHVRNNGGDGDDWSRNNIVTGGAGAIGRAVKYDPLLAKAIAAIGAKDN